MRRSRLRFSLRTLLVSLTVFAVWLGFHVRGAPSQKEAVEAIEEYGGWVRYDFQFPSGSFDHKDFDPQAVSRIPTFLLDRIGLDFFHAVVQVNLNYTNDGGVRQENHNPSDEALEFVGKLPKLRALLLSDTQASDRSLEHLAGLTKLERLYMWDAVKVSDAGVRHLAALKELRYIHLSESQITDEAMRVFAALPKLEGLALQGNRFSNNALKYISTSTNLKSLVIGRGDITVDDGGLVYLKELRRLERLGLQKSRISDDGLIHLEGLSNLKTLWISENDVVGPGVDRLKASLPALTIQ